MKCDKCGARGRNVETVLVGAAGLKENLCPGCVDARVSLLNPPKGKNKPKPASFSDDDEDYLGC